MVQLWRKENAIGICHSSSAGVC